MPTLAAAKAWRQEAQVELRHERLRAPSETLLEEAAERWLYEARTGVVRTRSSERYKPSAIRSYEAALRRFILPELGHLRISAVSRARVQGLIDGLVARKFAPSTVGNAVLPLRAIFRHALDRDEVASNPTLNLRLPKDRRQRDRVAEPREVATLLDALPLHHRALWATAAYTGLRRGELQALRWESVDLDQGVLRVTHSWDRCAGLVAPKSRSGERVVPIPGRLRGELLQHKLRQGAGGSGFVFAIGSERPFDPPNVLRVAQRAWKQAGLSPISFHECRHSYASFMIAAGVNAKALCAFMGHSSIEVTMDRYGHLMPGSEREAAKLLDHYLLSKVS